MYVATPSRPLAPSATTCRRLAHHRAARRHGSPNAHRQDDHANVLLELSKLAVINNYTMILAWRLGRAQAQTGVAPRDTLTTLCRLR